MKLDIKFKSGLCSQYGQDCSNEYNFLVNFREAIKGLSAYEQYRNSGGTLSESEFNNSLLNVNQIDDKVDKENGKGLSSNDFTDEDKAEVAKIDGKINISDIAPSVGNFSNKVMSQKAITNKFKEDEDWIINIVNTKLSKTNVVSTSGDSEVLAASQKLVKDSVSELNDKKLSKSDIEQTTGSKTDVPMSQDASTKSFGVLQSLEPYPTVAPTLIGQRLMDNKKRFYNAIGTESVLDWDIAENIGAKGVKVGDTNLYTPSIVENKTFEIWFKPYLNITSIQVYTRIYSLSSTASYIHLYCANNTLVIALRRSGLDTIYFGIVAVNPHVVISIFDNFVTVWVNGVIVFDTVDYSATPLNTTSGFCQNGTYFSVKEYNFKPTDEQVKEWYNGGRPDKYIPTTTTAEHEYLPQSIQPHKWVDTGATPTDIALTDNISYEPPYVENLFGTAAPTVIPDCIGQTYTDTAAKIAYKAVGTSTAADWKQITN